MGDRDGSNPCLAADLSVVLALDFHMYLESSKSIKICYNAKIIMDFLITTINPKDLNVYVHEVEMDILELLTDPSRVSIDIGANIGRYTELLVSLSTHVYAYEPLPQLAEIISKKFKGQGVTVFAKAVSDRRGTVDIHIPEWNDKKNSRRVYLDGNASIVQDFSQNVKRHSEIFSGVGVIKVPTIVLDD